MAAGNRDRRDQLMPQLIRQLLELGVVERAQILGFVDPIEQRRGTIGTHSLYPADVWEGLRRIDPLSMTFIGLPPPLQLSYRRGRIVSPGRGGKRRILAGYRLSSRRRGVRCRWAGRSG